MQNIFYMYRYFSKNYEIFIILFCSWINVFKCFNVNLFQQLKYEISRTKGGWGLIGM